MLRRRLLPLPLRAGRRGPRGRRAQRALVHGAALGRGRVRVSLVLAVPEPLVVLARRPRGLARAVDRERLHGDAVRGGLDAARVGRRDRAAGVVGVLARGRHGSGSVRGGLRGRLLLLLRRHLLWLLLLLLLLHLLRGGLGPNRGFTARRARPVPVRGLLLARVGILDVLCYQAPVSQIPRRQIWGRGSRTGVEDVDEGGVLRLGRGVGLAAEHEHARAAGRHRVARAAARGRAHVLEHVPPLIWGATPASGEGETNEQRCATLT